VSSQKQPSSEEALEEASRRLNSERPEDFVAARGRIVRQASSLVFMQGNLTVDGDQIATACAILKIK